MPSYVVVYYPNSKVWKVARDRGTARSLMVRKTVNKDAFIIPAKTKEAALAMAKRGRAYYESVNIVTPRPPIENEEIRAL
jgi:hypothetical protein